MTGRTSIVGMTTISLLTGAIALACAVLQPPATAVSAGFVASTVGITAILTGRQALALARWRRPRSRIGARVGITLGIVGTTAMAYAMLATVLVGVGVTVPPSPIALSSHVATDPVTIVNGLAMSSDGAAASGTTADTSPSDSIATESPSLVAAPPVSVPVPDLGPATAAEEREELSRATGTLVFALQQSAGRTGPWPEQLFLLESSPAIVTTADGVRLVSLPVTAQLSYSTDATRSRFAVEMTGTTFGQTTRYDSVSGVVTTG